MAKPLTLGFVKELPPPVLEGPYYDAVKAYVQQHGQPRPIHVDGAGTAWTGHTLLAICSELGLVPETALVDDGPAAAIHELVTRDLNTLEQALLVRAVYEGSSTNFVLPQASKRSEAVSLWFKQTLGKERGYSPSQIEQFVRIARAPEALHDRLAQAENLYQAMRILKGAEAEDATTTNSGQESDLAHALIHEAADPSQGAPALAPAEKPPQMELPTEAAGDSPVENAEQPALAPPPAEDGPDPSPESIALDKLKAFLDSAVEVTSWSAHGTELLRGTRDVLEMIVSMGPAEPAEDTSPAPAPALTHTEP